MMIIRDVCIWILFVVVLVVIIIAVGYDIVLYINLLKGDETSERIEQWEWD